MKFWTIVATALVLFTPLVVHAAGGGKEKPASQHWSFNGPFGTYDRAALQRGLKVYRQVCAACHGLERVYFRNLEALGYTEAQIKTIAAEYTVTDGPDEEGQMFDRPGLPSDRFVPPYPNEQAARASNAGAMPWDLSLMTKARKNGSNYMYALLTGYEDPPEDANLLPGQYWNRYKLGNVIAMAPPLSDGLVAYEDGSPESVKQYAKDVTHFLTWAADPYMEDRKRLGIRVLIFLAIFAAIMYALKKKIWKSAH